MARITSLKRARIGGLGMLLFIMVWAWMGGVGLGIRLVRVKLKVNPLRFIIRMGMPGPFISLLVRVLILSSSRESRLVCLLLDLRLILRLLVMRIGGRDF
jgi:hypothetical protein